MRPNTEQKLFSPVQIGPITLGHRVVMAPLTRSRSEQPGDIPRKLMLEYYTQRASEGGFIISEGTSISIAGRGWFGAPGMYSDEQVAGWKKITSAVHTKGGRMFSQLWHVGRSSNVSMTNGATPVAPSVNPKYWNDSTPSISTSSGWLKPSPHRALDISEIPGIVEDYRKAAERAKAAGFDGVELHAANGYLPDEFLQDGSNKRTDAYGGSIEHRSRFLLEIVEAMASVWGGDRIAVRIGPGGTWNSMSDSNPAALFDYLAAQLNRFGLAYLHIIEPRVKGSVLIAEGQEPVATERLRKIFRGKIIAAGGFEPDTAETIVEKGDADLVAFGRHFLANPDLPRRIRLGLPLNDYDRKTFYTFDFHGYTDYPFYEQQRDGMLPDPFCPQLHDSPFYFDSRLHAAAAQASAIASPRSESKNKALVLDAFDTLFNKRDYVAAEHFWSPNYIQHSAHIAAGREGLFNLIKSIPPTLKYEPGIVVAEGDLVIVHGRFSGFGQPENWTAADIVRIADGVLAEHWDVIQDEASRESSKSGLSMFGEKFRGSLNINSKTTKERKMETKTNVVLVHGAWVDGSSWSKVIPLLQSKLFNVTAVQLPLTSLDDDIAVTRNMLAAQKGPTVLVGHSYGGLVITGAANDSPNVNALVYIAAFGLDERESIEGLSKQGPAPAGAAQIRPDDHGFLWIDRDGFAQAFAADADPVEARVMAAVQKPFSVKSFVAKSGPPAWKHIPSWYLVSTNDQMIPPQAEEFMAKRMGATVRTVPASHASMVSHPREVADIITLAAESGRAASVKGTRA